MRFDTPPDRLPARGVTVEKRKWDGSVSARWTAMLTAADDDLWSWWTPSGTLREHPRTGRATRCSWDEVTVGCGAGWLLTMTLDSGGRVLACQADAVLPPVLSSPDLVTFVDLDLDLAIHPETGDATLLDEADLAERSREMRYPDSVVRAAWEGIADVRGRLENGRWPFRTVAEAGRRSWSPPVPGHRAEA